MNRRIVTGINTLVDSATFDLAKRMSDAVLMNWAARRILNQTDEKENKIEWEDYGYKHRGILDAKGDIILDLKSCADAEPRKFQRDVLYMDYHLQGAMYSRAAKYAGMDKNIPFYVIAVDPSLGVSCHKLDSRLIEYAESVHKKIISKFNQCAIMNQWDSSYEFWAPEKSAGIYKMEKPSYMLNEL